MKIAQQPNNKKGRNTEPKQQKYTNAQTTQGKRTKYNVHNARKNAFSALNNP